MDGEVVPGTNTDGNMKPDKDPITEMPATNTDGNTNPDKDSKTETDTYRFKVHQKSGSFKSRFVANLE